MRFRKEIEVDRSAEDAFAYVTDFSNAEEWDPGVAEATKLTDGPVRLGSEFDLVALFRGKRHRFHYVVTDFEQGRRIVLAAEGDRVRSVDQVTVEPAGTGSRITYVADLQLKGIFRPASPLLGPAMSRMGDAALTGLKTVLERPR